MPNFSIERKVELNGLWAELGTTDNTTYEDKSNLQNNQTYYYRVKRSDEQVYSNEVNIKYTLLSSDNYSIERRDGLNGSFSEIGIVTGNTFEDRKALQDGTTYYYKVRRLNTNEYSDIASVNYTTSDIPPIGSGYSLKTAGAVGNGVADDSSILNNLIASSPSGSTIIIDQGYRFNLNGKNITITKPLIFNGTGSLINGHFTVNNINGLQVLNITTENFYVILSNLNNTIFNHVTFSNILNQSILGFMTLSGNFNGLKISNCIFHDITNNGFSSTYGCALKLSTTGTFQNIEIDHNQAYNIDGPAAFWFGTSGTISNLNIHHNHIYNTFNFGIEFYQYNGTLNGNNVRLEYNTIHDIGKTRTLNYGNGCGGIYNNVSTGSFYANYNDVRRVLEVGIEGYYLEIHDNYIEDTGADQLNHPITDNAGIYMHAGNNTKVFRNIIVNPGGYYGGIHRFESDVASGHSITDNTIKNVFKYWAVNTNYLIGDLVVSNNLWFICKQSGKSGNTAPTTKTANITDGSVRWDYKKEFCKNGVNLNAVKGISDSIFERNTIEDIQTAFALSGLISNVSIQYNKHLHNNLTHGEPITFLGGYGSRSGPQVIIANNV